MLILEGVQVYILALVVQRLLYCLYCCTLLYKHMSVYKPVSGAFLIDAFPITFLSMSSDLFNWHKQQVMQKEL
jgi:hypothetical protein